MTEGNKDLQSYEHISIKRCPYQPHIEWVKLALMPDKKRTDHESRHSLPFNQKIMVGVSLLHRPSSRIIAAHGLIYLITQKNKKITCFEFFCSFFTQKSTHREFYS